LGRINVLDNQELFCDIPDRQGRITMAVWVIRIINGAAPGDPAQFVPQLQPPDADGLLAQAGDLVSWNNRTDDVHQPWPTDANYVPLADAQVGPRGSQNYLSDEIDPDGSSRPSWVVAPLTFPAPPPPPPVSGKTIYYCCRLHPQERGKINITP
jgi:hypothetical protein